MVKHNKNFLFRLLNIWCAFIALLFFSSHLPRWHNFSYHAWINEASYFLLFLLAVSIFIKDKHNKDIFFNLGLFLLAHSFLFLNIFVGQNYLFGNDYTSYYFFHYKKLVLCFLLDFFIIYTVLKYLFSNQKPWVLYPSTLAILLPVIFFHFHSYLVNPKLIFVLGEHYMNDLFRRIVLTHFLALFFVFLYGYLLYKKDKILGEHINVLMACFFVILVTAMIDDFSRVYNFRIYSVSQYVLTINLIFLCTVLFKKLIFLCSDYGQFYETLIKQNGHIGKIRIQRRHGEAKSLLIQIVKAYVYQRRNYLLALALLTTVGIVYFRFPKFFTINIIAFLCCFVILFWFINLIYKKRSRQKYILP